MQDVLLTFFQALQLVALGPCLFIIAFLLLTGRHPAKVIIPVLYFLSLSASFLLPLLPLFLPQAEMMHYGTLLFIESLTPALLFLLVLQFIYARMPHPLYWLVLAIPVIGGSSFIYGVLHFDDICLMQDYCLPTQSLKTLYQLISSGLIFLLLIVHFSRHWEQATDDTSYARGDTYWLIVALILLSLMLMAVDLGVITERIPQETAGQVTTIIRLGFVYLVLSLLFRIFDRTIDLDATRIPTFTKNRQRESDGWIIRKLEEAMEIRHLYRDIPSLEILAETLGIPEHQLSRVINSHHQQSFTDYVNGYRLREARQRLQHESTPITTIAYEVGFGSIPTFNRVFKEKVGQTPSQYRKETR